ncbi:AMP-binding protein [Paractinoplanes brasiliensis]|uniref:Acyl-CoA synthetase (AMP-forming)/AMP-acid ligase II n=1 Tax=Paractinoplanes brasiliensis TaxID=52695 RepID=A0A4R6J8F7_9ACTN|nr:AMP-binding protein [Actinoplanes brasiliensis]TDO31874.1 acyl-CoA synthetase (AMP-forming)/AMP-acid ligase II [Actinoplanes brasiliensis]GID27917.1 fatty-acyl-CoA synthase [Actinoplanes brasiliensis]
MLFVARTMARRGLLTPGPPHRVARQLAALHTWKFGLAGELRQAAARSPARVALIDEGGVTTYGELLDRTSRLAAALPVEPGDRVGILSRNSSAMVEALIAVATLGADPVLMNTGLSPEQLAAVARDQRLALILHDASLVPPPGVPALPFGQIGYVTPLTKPPSRPGRTIILTSGTTGVPKGAHRPTPGGFSPLCSIIDRIPLTAGVRMLIAAPLFHTWGYAGLQIALALRATVVLRSRFDPADTLDTLADQDCTAMIAVPVMLQRLLEQPAREVPLKIVAVSGSALPGGLATRFMDSYGDVVYNLYGSTEASWASIATPADLRAAPTTAGRPPHGTIVAALDEDGRPVPPGTPGRLFVGNEMLFEGYTNGAARELNGGLLATGDIGHLDEEGRVFVDGRQDDMIVSGGENVFPSEVEDLLAARPEVREVAVIGVADDRYGQRLAAYVVLHEGAELTADAVRDHVRARLARFSVPRDVVFLPELPRNATGKILKRELA